MKKKINLAIAAMLFSFAVFGQDGFSAVNPTLLPNGTYVIVYPPGQNSTAVPLDSLLGKRPYKVYTALLSQTGTSAPVATVLENNTGVTWTWTRNSIGDYRVTPSSGSLSFEKTTCEVVQQFIDNAYPEEAGFRTIYVENDNNSNRLKTTDVGWALSDNKLGRTKVEIRVYP